MVPALPSLVQTRRRRPLSCSAPTKFPSNAHNEIQTLRGTPLAPSTAIADIDLTSCFDYRWCAFAPRAHQGYRVDMNTRAGLG
jgi:hypothetical protein